MPHYPDGVVSGGVDQSPLFVRGHVGGGADFSRTRRIIHLEDVRYGTRLQRFHQTSPSTLRYVVDQRLSLLIQIPR